MVLHVIDGILGVSDTATASQIRDAYKRYASNNYLESNLTKIDTFTPALP